MSFVSLEFLIFLIAVFVVFYSIPQRFRISVLVGASVIFLMSTSPLFIVYSTLFTASNFIVGKAIGNKELRYRKHFYYGGQIFNIGGLVFYKYINFLLENINQALTFFSFANVNYLSIAIPLGISYYTFQGISYLYLIYKANDKPEGNIMNMALYMLFFPKIMAGPIERHRTFLPQLQTQFVFDYQRVTDGIRLVLWGLFKKVVVGDTFAIMVNKIHGNVDSFSGQLVLIAFLLQPLQLYFDFSGYTDMAIGIARVFGIKLSPNFNRPFFARTVGDFWRRWHISLSSWCNDFIYNRLLVKHRKWGERSAYYSIFVCFMIIGIWHGAKWTYVVVGLLQVLALSYEFITRRWRATLVHRFPSEVVIFGSRILVYLFVSIFLSFFFADSVDSGFNFITHVFSVEGLGELSLHGLYNVREEFVVALIAALFVLYSEYLMEKRQISLVQLQNTPVAVRWVVYIMALLFIVYFSKNETVFVYRAF